MRRLLFALTTMAMVSKPTVAAEVSFKDIVGRWCQSDGANITFAKKDANVAFPTGVRGKLKINSTKQYDGGIRIIWDPPKRADGGANATDYRLSDDKRLLIQMPNQDASGRPTGDKGPQRELRPC